MQNLEDVAEAYLSIMRWTHMLKKGTPIYPYETNTWGPKEVERVTPRGGWRNPTVGQPREAVAGEAA
jgi:hypothetical protein